MMWLACALIAASTPAAAKAPPRENPTIMDFGPVGMDPTGRYNVTG